MSEESDRFNSLASSGLWINFRSPRCVGCTHPRFSHAKHSGGCTVPGCHCGVPEYAPVDVELAKASHERYVRLLRMSEVESEPDEDTAFENWLEHQERR